MLERGPCEVRVERNAGLIIEGFDSILLVKGVKQVSYIVRCDF